MKSLSVTNGFTALLMPLPSLPITIMEGVTT
jgi:hypothetical protein